MSEYWVSKKKYFCKYCDIYITDDAPSRQQHENGLRHKGNRDRFIRGLYKEGERRKKDQAEEKREMARVEQAAQAAFAVDVGAGFARQSTAQPSTSAAPPKSKPKPKPKPSNLFADYSTASSLGYTDPDAERILLEAQRRRSEGIAGNWEVVEPTPPQDTESSSSQVAGVKHPADDHASKDDSRHFQLRKRTLDAGLGQIYDPGAIPIKRKREDSEVDIPGKAASPSGKESLGSSGIPISKWKKAGEINADSEDIEKRPDALVKDEEGHSADVKVEENALDIKPNINGDGPTSEKGASLFRKRKSALGGTRGKRSI
ncbi:uncharacterized protein BT62DRAFT_931801 [Guyanagaster necrorhizus]|uniref:Matrin-type domain-containing protein n=1 Tax=Guyanagaster necrorhizus TaxID=856835 RepID=A0A9P7VRZ7_9AGAR|nr:uncharacterized protein BT62DRAFT_931801 [Guyanagaster necrorhizus MCA 3950]KAG7446353.1 hypothetical protein BT62DRAFT_931801 [Guyanagaster necrorhizus MCA 3950]